MVLCTRFVHEIYTVANSMFVTGCCDRVGCVLLSRLCMSVSVSRSAACGESYILFKTRI